MDTFSSLLWQNNHEGSIESFSNFFKHSERLPLSMNPAHKMVCEKQLISTLSFNHFGDKLITACANGTIWLWDIAARLSTPQVILRSHNERINTINFLSSNCFLSAGEDSSIKVIKMMPTGAVATVFNNHHVGKVTDSFPIDENTFVTCSIDKTIHLIDIRQKYFNTSHENLDPLTVHDITSVSNEIVGKKIEKQEDMSTESLLYDLSAFDSQILSIDVHPIDKNTFATGCSDGIIRFFDIRNPNSQETLPSCGFSLSEAYNSKASITGVSFSENGERIAASVLSGNIHVFDTSLCEDIPHFNEFRSHSQRCRDIKISDFLCENGDIDFKRIEETLDEQQSDEELDDDILPKNLKGCIATLKGHKSFDSPKNVKWLGNFIVTGSDDSLIYIYDSNTGILKKVLKSHNSCVNCVAIHNEKHLIASSGFDDFALLWEPSGFTNIDKKMNILEVEEALNSYSSQEIIPEMAGCEVF